MGAPLDIAGQRFGRLVVIERAGRDDLTGASLWRCRCDCGAIHVTRGKSLTSGRTRSCGCYRVEHGERRAREMHASRARLRTAHAWRLDHAEWLVRASVYSDLATQWRWRLSLAAYLGAYRQLTPSEVEQFAREMDG